MAIYTNYGRYLKAKQFKENLESAGDTYMVFGIGNPLWDASDANKVEIPIAPYNTEIMTVGDVNTNQFFDDQAAMYFNSNSVSGGVTSCSTEAMLKNSTYIPPEGSAPGTIPEDDVKKYMYLCRRIIPPFPSVYQSNVSYEGAQEEAISDIQNYFITKETNKYILRSVTNPSDDEHEISLPSTTSLDMQYFTEMYLRGKVLWNHSGGTGALRENVKPMVGLLGAVRCKVDFVKDIGPEGSNNYTGGINQFWYGDRYWEIVDPTDDIIHINEDDSSLQHQYLETGNNIKKNQGAYPHHLIFTATVNPRYLCDELEIDQYVVPRQIAIYTRPRVDGVEGPHYYRAYEHVFDFGQYSSSQYHYQDDPEPPNLINAQTALGEGAEILHFSLPCYCSYDHITRDGEFKFLLNDYIRGQVRESHSIDRFGYVIGF